MGDVDRLVHVKAAIDGLVTNPNSDALDRFKQAFTVSPLAVSRDSGLAGGVFEYSVEVFSSARDQLAPECYQAFAEIEVLERWHARVSGIDKLGAYTKARPSLREILSMVGRKNRLNQEQYDQEIRAHEVLGRKEGFLRGIPFRLHSARLLQICPELDNNGTAVTRYQLTPLGVAVLTALELPEPLGERPRASVTWEQLVENGTIARIEARNRNQSLQ